VVVGGTDLTDEFVRTLGAYGAKKVFRAQGPEGLAQPIVDVFGQGHLRARSPVRDLRRRPARLRDRGRPRRPQAGGRDDGGHGDPIGSRHPDELVAERPILGDSKISVSRYRGDLGIIISRINAFRDPRERRCRR